MTEIYEVFELLGRTVVTEQKLTQLRRRLGVSLSYMSELMDLSVSTYRNWELNPELGVLIRAQLAIKAGRFYQRAVETLEGLQLDGDLTIEDLIPFYAYAEVTGQPVEFVLEQCRRGLISLTIYDLGILGPWIQRDQLPHLGMVA